MKFGNSKLWIPGFPGHIWGKRFLKSGRVQVYFLLGLSLSTGFYAHYRAYAPELRYTRVAEGNMSKAINIMWTSGWTGYTTVLRTDAEQWGRVRPLHNLFHSVSYLLTMTRNGDLFYQDTDVPLNNRMNGDLQTHSLYLLFWFGMSAAAMAIVTWRVSGAFWAACLVPLLILPGNRYLNQNLLVNFADSGEIGQLGFLSLYLVLISPVFSQSSLGKGRELLASVLLVCAYGMKETTLVVLPVMIALLIFASIGAGKSFKKFAQRHAVIHILFSAILLITIYSYKSGAYTGEHFVMDQLGSGFLRSWKFMTLFSETIPYLIVGGVMVLIMLFRQIKAQGWSKGMTMGLRTEFLWLLVCAGICSGFWAINIPWSLSLDKYFLPAHFFACATAVLIAHFSWKVLWSANLRPAAVVWLLGSMLFLFGKMPERISASRGYYHNNYTHRLAVPAIVKDIAVESGSADVYRVHVVASHLYQEGALPILRWLNRLHDLNISSDGNVVSNIRAIETNFFRTYKDAGAVEVTMSQQVPDEYSGDAVYMLSRPSGAADEMLVRLGFIREEMMNTNLQPINIWKYEKLK